MKKFETLKKLVEYKKQNSLPLCSLDQYKQILTAFKKRQLNVNHYLEDFRNVQENYVLNDCIIIIRALIVQYEKILDKYDSEHHRSFGNIKNKKEHLKKCEKSSKLRNIYDNFLIEAMYMEDPLLKNSNIPICIVDITFTRKEFHYGWELGWNEKFYVL